jgi:hypothetical protein
MQPPLIFENFRETVSRLKSEALSERAGIAQAVPKKNIADEYVERIQTWVSTLPPIQRCRQFTITEVIALATLTGHFRPNASLRYTGEALRRCGFKQKRDWTEAGRNKRYWQFVGDKK